MRTLSALRLIGLTGCIGVVACSSSKDDANSGTTSTYKPSGTSGQYAQDTVDGQAAISASTATSLTSNANACAQWNETPQGSAQPILEFVIDASGSMSSDPANPADPNGPSKWDVFSTTMPSVFASLPATFAVGVSYYNKSKSGDFTPNQVVPIGILDAAQLAKTQQSIQSANVGGYTPTYNAWLSGLKTVSNWQTPAGYETSPKYLVVITDGVPTVMQDGRTVENPISQTEYDLQLSLIQSQQGTVKTFVVGVVGSENPQGATYDPLYMLSKLAVIGGTAPAGCVPKSGTPAGTTVNPRGTYCHFDLSQAADFATALTNSLGTIAQSVVSCDYAVPVAPAGKTIDPSQIVLVYNQGNGSYSLILQNTSATCDKGWQFTDTTNSNIHICGVTCDEIQSNSAAQLDLVFGCGVSQIVN